MARLAAAFASGGNIPTPRLVGTEPGGLVGGILPEHFELIRDGMRDAVVSGTAWRARMPLREVAGKTGTAQVASANVVAANNEDRPYELRTHAWFVGFAPFDDPEIAVAVVVEHGGAGGAAAAPIGGEILRTFFEDSPEARVAGGGAGGTSESLRAMELRAREGVDRVLLVSVGLLVLIALLLLESALRGVGSGATLSAHVIRLGLALGVGVAAYHMDHRRLARLSPALFLVALGLSAIAITSGAVRAGTRRWLEVGTLTLQPGELAKISLVLLLAHLIARSRHEPLSRRATVGWIAASGALVLAVAAQPDLGSAAILFGIGVGMVFFSGVTISRKWMLAAGGSAVMALPLIWVFGLRDYQRTRILSFLNPESDPLGAGVSDVAGFHRGRFRRPLRYRVAPGAAGPASSFSRLLTPTSSSRCLPRSSGSWAWWPCSALYLVLGLRPPADRGGSGLRTRIRPAPSWWAASFSCSISRRSTTSRWWRGSSPSRGSPCRS